MGLAAPLGLALLLALPLAAWLARRGAGRVLAHPLWFLVPARPTHGRRRGGIARTRWLLVVAIGLIALGAAGPVWRAGGGARVLVIDLSATRARDVEQVRSRLADVDEVVLARPGRPPERRPAAGAGDVLVPTSGMVDAVELAAAVELALPGARRVELATAPSPGADVGIAAVTLHRDPLAGGRARLVVELAAHGGHALPATVVARGADGGARGEAAVVAAGEGGFAVLELTRGGERVELALSPAAGDDVALDDTATIDVPDLGPAPVWIAPTLRDGPVARALAALATGPGTVALVDAPAADVVAVVDSGGWQGPARARLVVTAPPVGSPSEPLARAVGAPLPGVTTELLAATPAVAVVDRSGVGAAIAPARVWLRAGPHPAVWADDDGGPTVHVAAALDGPVLPVLLADALAAPPLAPSPAPAAVATIAAPASAPPLPAPPAGRRQPWPTTTLLAAAALLLLVEAALTRPRWPWLVARAAAVALVAVAAAAPLRPAGRRVALVLDLSASVDPGAARAAAAARAAGLGKADRAALVVVAGGARTVVPLGPPAAVVAWLERDPPPPAALGLDPDRTDLATGLALAGDVLAGAGGELVLVGDGRDTERGADGVRAAPALIGRGFDLVPVDDGDQVRLDAPRVPLVVAPGATIALPLTITARVPLAVELVVDRGGRVLARRSLDVAAGRTELALPVTLPRGEATAPTATDAAPLVPLTVELSTPGERVTADDRATVALTVAGAPRTWRVAEPAALAPGALAARLAAVDRVILDDLPGTAVGPDSAAALDRFVRGGGTLLWAAGPRVAAAGAGALASLLPVTEGEDDPVALLLLVDRSGSIDAAGRLGPMPGPADLAAVATALAPGDEFGALGFDVAPLPWLPLRPAGALATVPALPVARGGTDPSAALVEAGRLLSASAGRRIVVVVTDGGFPDHVEAAVAAAASLAAAGIRVEVVAAGDVDAAASLRLDRLATAGGGRVHRLASSLGTVVPALRRRPAAPVGPARARARATWSTLLGEVPAPLVRGLDVARHVVLAPVADAVVLADVGDDPLLAIARRGAGTVLAWTADLDGAWLERGVAVAVEELAVRTRAGLDVSVTPREDGPAGALELVVTASGDPPATAVLESAERTRTVPLVPAAVGTARGRLDPGRTAATLLLGDRRLPLAVVEPEHARLGVDPAVARLVRPAPPRAHRRAWRWLIPAGTLAIALVLWVLRSGGRGHVARRE